MSKVEKISLIRSVTSRKTQEDKETEKVEVESTGGGFVNGTNFVMNEWGKLSY